jgi:RimJ/RimL family protein N-acetyltransferase
MQIETERLVLRRWSEADVDDLARIHSHPAVAAWLGPRTPEEAARTVERYERHWEEHGFGRFAVADRGTGMLVVRVGVMRQPDWVATAEKDEVGWVIAAERWGEGLATEAAAAAIEDAFDRVALDRVVSWTTPDNLASRRVMEKCGLRYRGRAAWKGRAHVWYDVRATGRRA